MSARIVLALLMIAAAPVAAQVIEIGDDGAAITYDRPTLFTGDATAPVAPPPVAAEPPVDLIAAAAIARGLPPALLQAVAWRESRFRQDAVSRKGALGVMQLMPGTAAELGVDPRDLAQNLAGGATYLRRQIDRFGSVPLGLAAYNAGPGAVIRHGGIPPFAETRAYVRAILGRWRPADLSAISPLLIETP